MGLTKKHESVIRNIENILADGDEFSEIAEEFITGGCYVYAKIIQLIIPSAVPYINYAMEHVIVKLDGVSFDSIGIHNYSGHKLDDEDEEHCLYNYGLCSFEYPEDSIYYIEDMVSAYTEKYGGKEKEEIEKRLDDYLTKWRKLLCL